MPGYRTRHRIISYHEWTVGSTGEVRRRRAIASKWHLRDPNRDRNRGPIPFRFRRDQNHMYAIALPAAAQGDRISLQGGVPYHKR